MVNLSAQLATRQFAQMDFEERSYGWYPLLGTATPDLEQVDSLLPAVDQEGDSWCAYVWSIKNDKGGGRLYERHLIRKGFRTKQLAKITANYFILHCLINKTNETSTDQGAML